MQHTSIYKILLIISVPIFLLGATVFVLIISQGGSVTTEGFNNETGVIKINTDPEDIEFTLTIDNKPVDVLNNKGTTLTAGTHLIRIDAEGMASWEKRISVTKGIVNEVYAKLFPIKMALTQITKSNIESYYFSPFNDFVFFVVNNSEPTESGIWKVQLNQNNLFFLNNYNNPLKFCDLNSDISPLLANKNYELIINNDGNKIIIHNKGSNEWLILSSSGLNQTLQTLNLNLLLGFSAEDVSWFNNSNSLLVKTKNIIFEYNLSSKLSTLISYSPDSQTLVSYNSDQVIIFSKQQSVFSIYSGQSIKPLQIVNINSKNQIEELYLAKRTNRFLAIQAAQEFIFVDIEKGITKSIPMNDARLISRSVDGMNYIFADKENSLFSFSINENVGLNQLESKITPLNIKFDSSKDSIHYSPQSTSILYYSALNKSITSYDIEGNNATELLKNDSIEGIFDFDNQANYLLVQLSESIVEQNGITTKNSNLYKLNIMKTSP